MFKWHIGVTCLNFNSSSIELLLTLYLTVSVEAKWLWAPNKYEPRLFYGQQKHSKLHVFSQLYAMNIFIFVVNKRERENATLCVVWKCCWETSSKYLTMCKFSASLRWLQGEWMGESERAIYSGWFENPPTWKIYGRLRSDLLEMRWLSLPRSVFIWIATWAYNAPSLKHGSTSCGTQLLNRTVHFLQVWRHRHKLFIKNKNHLLLP